jgi:hypothetical protein
MTKNLEKSEIEKINTHGGAREGAGRPAFKPTDAERQQVEAMVGYGVPQEQIAILVRGGIDVGTLAKYFEKELVAGKAKANYKVGQTLFSKAVGGDTSACIFWAKTQMGWRESQNVSLEHSGQINQVTRKIVDAASNNQIVYPQVVNNQ